MVTTPPLVDRREVLSDAQSACARSTGVLWAGDHESGNLAKQQVLSLGTVQLSLPLACRKDWVKSSVPVNNGVESVQGDQGRTVRKYSD